MNSVKKIAVVGLGYVGLPLALLAETKGFTVTGIDLNSGRVAKLKAGKSPIDEPLTVSQVEKSKINFTSSFEDIADVDAVIICVPTPVDESKTPDLGPVIGAVKSSVPKMKKGSLLVIESTINPGVCDEVVIPLVEEISSHKVGETIHVAHCPERINPGDPKWHVGNINRVLGANSKEGLELAYDFYSNLVDAEVKKMGSIKEAEAVKVVENSFRDINIAFVNELAMSFDKLGINVNNVIDGAATKPFAFMPHYPGVGVGGHCIPVDPYYLIEYARGKGFDHKFLTLARNINEAMPLNVVESVDKALKESSKDGLKEKKVLVLGLSYKPNVADDRMSPSYSIIEQLEKSGAVVSTFDPFILDKSSEKTLKSALKDKDVIILATTHKQFLEINLADIDEGTIFFDGKNSFSDQKAEFEAKGIKHLAIGG